MTPAMGLERLSLNQMTTKHASLPVAVACCVRAGVPAIGLWRDPVAATGLRAAANLVADAGLRVSSLCRGGFLTSRDPETFGAALADNRRAIDDCSLVLGHSRWG